MSAGSCSLATHVAASDVDAAFVHCAEITRARARNFYYGLRLLPQPRRTALFAVYAWMRRADDLADDAQEGGDGSGDAVRQVEALRRTTDRVFDGSDPGDDPILVALADTVRRFDLDREPFHRMLDGQLADLRGEAYETLDELEHYCELVASTVGQVCVSIWGASGAGAMELARRRGIAFQLTNILRDFREDLDSGRVYLPSAFLAHHGIDANALMRFEPAEACRTALLELIERAEEHYRASGDLDDMIDSSCRPALWAMTRIYHGLLEVMRRNPARIALGPRVRLSAVRKGTIAIAARLRARRR